ncbi:16S rRNA (guanine(527)-N(7))-methyltransferase RsmG [Treponema primitia]|uniref:16S rRNA (guanine(527)-N(7))-methyltransferase RsmG n=1 Tax=Treponema primitia TaxID=88058 RepID=UPI0002555690|nr:16S rRNA (guanine(527)-N(7))-methyltransferase RsmG [Treponema primitia]
MDTSLQKGVLEEGLALLCRGDPDVEALLGSNIDRALRLLTKYIYEIELYNPTLGLVGTTEHRELVIRHILDSLSPLGILQRLVREQGGVPCIADVGSGAGLPGIPLAIALPDCSFTLVERKTRRAEFLRNVLPALGLSNAKVEEREMEKAPRFRFGIITFRAFRPLDPAILKGLFRLLAPGGVLAAYKGRQEKIAVEMGAIGELVGSWEAIPCPVPFLDEERHLVIIRPRV